MDNERPIVIKIGSAVLVSEVDRIRHTVVQSLAGQVAKLHEEGFRPLIVTSGAVACGKGLAPVVAPNDSMIGMQVAAITGQSRLMRHWDEEFNRRGLIIAQGLATYSEFMSQGTIDVLRCALEARVIPILNENDLVSTEEIKAMQQHADNDALAGVVAVAMDASRLIILTDVDGLYPDNPKVNSGIIPIPSVLSIDDTIMAMARRIDSDRPSGMESKLKAVLYATKHGIRAHIANGNADDIITRIMRGENVGTTFVPDA